MKGFKNFFENSVTYDYSCVMYRLPKKITNFILDWSNKNILDTNLCTDHKEGRVKDIHITVLYGLHTNSLKKIKKTIGFISPIKIKIGKITKFENKNFDVIKIDLKSSKLLSMNKKLKRLEHTSEYSNYIPHCTLAYVKKGSCDHLLGNDYFNGKTVFLKNLVFTPSIGNESSLVYPVGQK